MRHFETSTGQPSKEKKEILNNISINFLNLSYSTLPEPAKCIARQYNVLHTRTEYMDDL